jgi:hypothetical protein
MRASSPRVFRNVSVVPLLLLPMLCSLVPLSAEAASNRRDTPDPSQGAQQTTIVYDNFEGGGGYTLADYLTKWANPYGPGEMGITDTRSFTGGHFNVDAAPFQTAYDFSVYDHIKYLGVSTEGFIVPEVGSVTFSIDINAETPGTEPGRIIHGTYMQSGDPYAEPTIEGQQAGATLHMIDFGSGQLFDWFVSGHTAFTLIERLPSAVTGSPNYVGRDKMYTQIIDEVAIAPGTHTVAIRYSRDLDHDRVEYYLDGMRVSQVRDVGVPLDVQNVKFTGTYPSLGPGEPVRDQIGVVSIGHGLFSLLDAFPFQHPEAPELAVSIPLSERLFGQGARAQFDNVKVTISERDLKPNNAYIVPANYESLVMAPRDGGASVAAAPNVAAGGSDQVRFSAISPNPTRGSALMDFTVPRDARVRLAVFDMQGRTLGTLADGVFAAGRHQVSWTGRTGSGSVTPGLYYARLEVEGQQFVRRFAVVR